MGVQLVRGQGLAAREDAVRKPAGDHRAQSSAGHWRAGAQARPGTLGYVPNTAYRTTRLSVTHHLCPPALNPEALSKRILIDDVTHYAYGQTEDRSVELWVAGKAGWYKISPAKGYLPTFNRMVQAVDMYYFLMDRHQHGKKQLNPTFKNLCEQVSFGSRFCLWRIQFHSR